MIQRNFVSSKTRRIQAIFFFIIIICPESSPAHLPRTNIELSLFLSLPYVSRTKVSVRSMIQRIRILVTIHTHGRGSWVLLNSAPFIKIMFWVVPDYIGRTRTGVSGHQITYSNVFCKYVCIYKNRGIYIMQNTLFLGGRVATGWKIISV